MANDLPYLSSGVQIVIPEKGTPTATFHIWWQLIVDAIKDLLVNSGTTLIIDGGTAANTGTPYIAVDGGTA